MSFAQDGVVGKTTGTYAYEIPFLFRPVVVRYFPNVRRNLAPNLSVGYCRDPKVINECVDDELAQLKVWREADIPTARIYARGYNRKHDRNKELGDNWYARERIVGPKIAHLRIRSFYGLSQDTVDDANESWNEVPRALVRGGFMSMEQAEAFAQHNTAYNLANGTWTVLRPALMMK